ncbi:unnamed protein product [Gongylonema pulchrum]|uniref:NHR domain-containing protein n=1 Tax=Gongylonema pulchrum TaxID=637853 RepID=A0A3P7NSN0_9BILA|nr:unnamed protein product [Gongylonema pulchrum]
MWAYFDVYGTTQRIRLLGSVKVRSTSQVTQRAPPLPASSRNSRSQLDLCSETRAGSANELTAWPSTSTHPVQPTNPEDPSPFLTRRTQSVTGENFSGVILRAPSSAQAERSAHSATLRCPRPIFTTSNENLIDFLENLDSLHGRHSSETNVSSHRPHFPPPPVPARTSPVRVLSARPPLHPPPRPPPPAQIPTNQQRKQRSSNDDGELGDECTVVVGECPYAAPGARFGDRVEDGNKSASQEFETISGDSGGGVAGDGRSDAALETCE